MKPVRNLFAAIKSVIIRDASHEEPGSTRSDPVATSLAFDPLDADFVMDPYPLLARLQDWEPVHRGVNGAWVLTRYEDVLAALSDSRLGNRPSPYAVVNERNRNRFTCADVANNIIPFKDPPAHTKPRRLVSKAFLAFLKESSLDIEDIASELICNCKAIHDAKAKFDVLDDFATPFSVRVLSRVLGVPQEDEARLKAWSEWFFYLFSIIPSEDVRQGMDTALVEFRQYFRALLAARKEQPQDDLISVLLAADEGGVSLTDIEIIDHCMLLFADGVENVDRGIANAMYSLLDTPQQLTLLKEQPNLIKQAIEECLRYESPGQFIGRVALEDITLRGVDIKKHSGVLLVIGAANRDPRQFEQAAEFNIRRSPNAHLSFGKGRHACIGGPLVKLEMEVALTALLHQLPDLRLAESSATWEARLGHRWIAHLPVCYSPKP